MKKNKIVSILLLVIVLMTEILSSSTAFAVNSNFPEGEMEYREIKKYIQFLSGKEPDSPYPNFYITADGVEVARETYSKNVEFDLISNPYADKDIPVAATVPVGTKLKAISFSKPGGGSAITSHDWQMAYWNPEGKAYDNAYKVEITPNGTFEQVADKPGYMIFYLNVADNQTFNYKGKNKRVPFTNWSDRGKRRTKGREAENGFYRSLDWFYTPIKIQVVDSQDNIVMTELEVVDTETNKVMNKFTRTLNSKEPFDVKKQIISTTKKDGTVSLDKGKNYKIKAKYQYISFTEGAFDISNPANMNDKQKALSTEINKNELISKIAINNKLVSTNTKISSDKSNISLKNLEVASFEWDYVVPNDAKSSIKFKNEVSKIFDSKNIIKADDSAELTFKLQSNDIAAKAPVMLTDLNGKPTTILEKGKPQRALISFENIEGIDTIGLDSQKNPKLTIDVVVTDKNNKVILKETIKTQKEMKPKEVITFQTSEFTNNTSEIKVCGSVNKIHNELGFNYDTSNDKICRTFNLGAPDIGMKAPVTLKLEGKPINNVQIGGIHQAEFILKHYSGTEIVGTGQGNNKKIRVNVTISDGNRVIMTETVVVDKPLHPGGEIPIKPSGSFNSQTGKIIACAEVDGAHAKLGYNIANANDKICQAFSTVKNYSATDVKLSPSSINLGEKDKVKNTQVSINYTLGHEEATVPGDKALNPNPIVEIRHNGRVIARKNVSIGRNSSVRDYHTANINLSEGRNVFTVEVNPGPSRAELEFKPGMTNPYVDNKATGNINVTKNNKCIECNWKHTQNEWTETFSWVEKFCHTETYTNSKGKTKTRCVCETERWSEDHDFYERFTIDRMDFRSKWSKDTKSGWDNVSNFGRSKIKSGYGFELRVFTRYQTNRNILPKRDPYGGSGCSDSLRRSPGATAVDNNENVFVELPYKDTGGKNVCVLLEKVGVSGPWYDRVNEFQFKQRVTPSGKTERKMFINEGTRPGVNKVEVRTSRVDGYHPDRLNKKLTKVKKKMQDCSGFYIEVLPQDDMKTHVIQ